MAVAVLAYNEASRINVCLTSISEPLPIFVIDSGSTDSTRDLAAEAGATVLLHPQEGAFSIADQRNWTLDQLESQYSWILFIDADEQATPEFLKEALQVAKSASPDTYGFWAAPRFLYQGSWLKNYMGFPDWHSRLVRTELRLVGGTWETFPNHGSYGFLREPYLHFPDDRGFDQWIERHLRYAHARTQSTRDGRRPGTKRITDAISARLGHLRPWMRVAYPLFIRGGLFDGPSVWSYARRSLIYELMVAEIEREASRKITTTTIPRQEGEA